MSARLYVPPVVPFKLSSEGFHVVLLPLEDPSCRLEWSCHGCDISFFGAVVQLGANPELPGIMAGK